MTACHGVAEAGRVIETNEVQLLARMDWIFGSGSNQGNTYMVGFVLQGGACPTLQVATQGRRFVNHAFIFMGTRYRSDIEDRYEQCNPHPKRD